jgi:hypothetical protein
MLVLCIVVFAAAARRCQLTGVGTGVLGGLRLQGGEDATTVGEAALGLVGALGGVVSAAATSASLASAAASVVRSSLSACSGRARRPSRLPALTPPRCRAHPPPPPVFPSRRFPAPPPPSSGLLVGALHAHATDVRTDGNPSMTHRLLSFLFPRRGATAP